LCSFVLHIFDLGMLVCASNFNIQSGNYIVTSEGPSLDLICILGVYISSHEYLILLTQSSNHEFVTLLN